MKKQSGIIAVRRKGEAIEVCLIRRKGSEAWGIPKGFVDPGDTPEDAALKEAWEEAGLKGRVKGDLVGSYEYTKRNTEFAVSVYLMEVLDQDSDWPEATFRERRWVPLSDAASLLANHPARPLLDSVSRLAGDDLA